MDEHHDGTFPFGQPNAVRPARRATGTTRAMVVGTIPSAFHVDWQAPAWLAPSGERTGRVHALPVDAEPTPFWAGGCEVIAVLARWRAQVGFLTGDLPGEHGHVQLAASRGPLSSSVEASYLAPLGLRADEVAFTDVYPIHQVTRSHWCGPAPEGRHPGDTIEVEFNAIADQLGFAPSNLPTRFDDAELPCAAAERFSGRLADDLLANRPPLVISLGHEAYEAVLANRLVEACPPVPRFDDLCDRRTYGTMGTLAFGGWEADWLPLVHPDRAPARLTALVGGPAADGEDWSSLHTDWQAKTLR